MSNWSPDDIEKFGAGNIRMSEITPVFTDADTVDLELAKGKRNPKIKIKVPSGARIVVTDPKTGKVIYDSSASEAETEKK